MARFGRLVCILWLLAPVVCLAGDLPRHKVSLLPHWLPQAQFAGYMVALEKGFYKDAGLDVTLMRGGPEKPPFESLHSGEATFCTGWLSTAIKLRAKGDPVINIAQVMQRSALLLVAKKSSGITTVADLEGRKLGSWGDDFRIQPDALLRIYGLNVSIVPMYSTCNLFLKGAVDAATAMWYNEYHIILNSGLNPEELTVMPFSELGLNFPEDGMYCLEETYKNNPQACEQLVAASLRGWLYCRDHRDEALEIVMKYTDAAHTGTNRAHQRWMLARMLDLIFPDGDTRGMGRLKEQDYRRVGVELRELNVIQHIPPFEQFRAILSEDALNAGKAASPGPK
ncbi:MAG: ABC transporter substrate-binding protein [Desulfomonile tiedjei]|nr:ABC transporter substrate-binding protein [Desulfomonile tiedjei]